MADAPDKSRKTAQKAHTTAQKAQQHEKHMTARKAYDSTKG